MGLCILPWWASSTKTETETKTKIKIFPMWDEMRWDEMSYVCIEGEKEKKVSPTHTQTTWPTITRPADIFHTSHFFCVSFLRFLAFSCSFKVSFLQAVCVRCLFSFANEQEKKKNIRLHSSERSIGIAARPLALLLLLLFVSVRLRQVRSGQVRQEKRSVVQLLIFFPPCCARTPILRNARSSLACI